MKNINFRLKLNTLFISAPCFVPDDDIIKALGCRLSWVINSHQKVTQSHTTKHADTLWGMPHQFIDNDQKLAIYRQELKTKIADLQHKWQPIVGKYANQVLVKKMHTRWGSCNMHASRIWLSVYLPAYPFECTEYVFVHELCHLHHANHSKQFWGCVKKAMPDYKHWHEKLRSNL